MGQRKNNVYPPGWELERCANPVASPGCTSFGLRQEKPRMIKQATRHRLHHLKPDLFVSQRNSIVNTLDVKMLRALDPGTMRGRGEQGRKREPQSTRLVGIGWSLRHVCWCSLHSYKEPFDRRPRIDGCVATAKTEVQHMITPMISPPTMRALRRRGLSGILCLLLALRIALGWGLRSLASDVLREAPVDDFSA
jgi:hypothetical protein